MSFISNLHPQFHDPPPASHFLFEVWSQYVTQTSLEFAILLPQPPSAGITACAGTSHPSAHVLRKWQTLKEATGSEQLSAG